MQSSFDPGLVGLSYIVAVASSYTALELARRVSSAEGRSATWWLVGGAFAMGIGIWTMHFIGMLALSLPMAFTFQKGATAISLLVGIMAAGFAIRVASRKTAGLRHIGVSGLILGVGIAGMHYSGMAAMRMDAIIRYDWMIVGLSVVIAVVAAAAAIWIIFTLVGASGRGMLVWKVGAALVMGIAICGMHYTGMAAASYSPTHTALQIEPGDSMWLSVLLGVAALFILGVTHLTLFFDRRLGAERAIGERAEKTADHLSQILDESSNEIYFFEEESLQFRKVNHGARENLGYTENEMLGMTPLDIKPDYDEESFARVLAPLREGRQRDLLLETTHQRKDGSHYPVQVHLQLSRVTVPPLFVAIITDVSESRELEAQLEQARKMEAIGQLAAGVAHEINTPAQFVGDNTVFVRESLAELFEMVRMGQKIAQAASSGGVAPELTAALEAAAQTADLEDLAGELDAALSQSLDGIQRISSIVRAIKEFSHPGQKDLKRADVNRGISNTVTVASNEWKYVAEVELDLDPALPQAMCHAQEMDQVLLNLLVNAAHAISAKHPEGEKGLIRISTRAVQDQVEIRVSDNGCGIPESILDRVCDPFFTTKEVGKGTGQGLALAYRVITDVHGGTLKIESKEGVGSTFIVRIPVDQTKRQDRVAAGAPRSRPLTSSQASAV